MPIRKKHSKDDEFYMDYLRYTTCLNYRGVSDADMPLNGDIPLGAVDIIARTNNCKGRFLFEGTETTDRGNP